jgi:hypothetical protein
VAPTLLNRDETMPKLNTDQADCGAKWLVSNRNYEPGIEGFRTSQPKFLYRVKKGPSIFTSRNNAQHEKHDVVVWKWVLGNTHGAAWEDGHRYSIEAILAAENGDKIRYYGPLPEEVAECVSLLMDADVTVPGR